ncbi:MAG: ribose-5-phosphate isomerase, partial [Sphingobacteriaceae bacterium]
MKVGIAADHGGFELKEMMRDYLKNLGHDVVDFGANELVQLDDFPDYV